MACPIWAGPHGIRHKVRGVERKPAPCPSLSHAPQRNGGSSPRWTATWLPRMGTWSGRVHPSLRSSKAGPVSQYRQACIVATCRREHGVSFAQFYCSDKSKVYLAVWIGPGCLKGWTLSGDPPFEINFGVQIFSGACVKKCPT